MYMMFIEGELKPGKKDEFVKAWNNQIMPLLKKQDGFDFYALLCLCQGRLEAFSDRGICDFNHDLFLDVHLPAGREPQGSRFKLLASWQHASSGSSARYIYASLPPSSRGYAWGLQ